MVVLAHDLNLVDPDTTHSNAPLEFIRQLLAANGFYDRQRLTFTKAREFQVVATINPDLR